MQSAKPLSKRGSVLEQQLVRDGVEPKVQASAEWMYLWDEWDPSD